MKIALQVLIILLSISARAQDSLSFYRTISLYKINLIPIVLNFMYEETMSEKHAYTFQVGYSESEEVEVQVSSGGASPSQRTARTLAYCYKLTVGYRRYDRIAPEGSYWGPYFRYDIRREEVDARSGNRVYDHERLRHYPSLGGLWGYQLLLFGKFPLDLFVGLDVGYQIISSVKFNNPNVSWDAFAADFNEGIHRKERFRVGLRLGLLVGFRRKKDRLILKDEK